MLYGVNWSSPSHHEKMKELMDQIDYYDLLIDNFLHLDPMEILHFLEGKRVVFHIMWSRFMQRDLTELQLLADKIKHWCDILSPIYISDHVAVFQHNGVNLPLLAEIDYDKFGNTAIDRLKTWQSLLGCSLHLENFPSLLSYKGNTRQVDFFSRVHDECGSNTLCDLSNLWIQHINTQNDHNEWSELIIKAQHYHVAGFRRADTDPTIYIDSHDQPVSKDVLNFMSHVKKDILLNGETVTIERDEHIYYESICSDLKSVKRVLI